MQQIIKLSFVTLCLAFATSCENSNGSNKDNANLASKKSRLEALKKDRSSLDDKITALEKEIDKLDTSSASKQKPKLVSLTTIAYQPFNHYIELQGSVDNKNVSYIVPPGQPGQIKAIYVKQGDRVRKGQLVAKLDDAIAKQNLDAATQQVGSVKAQLTLAQSIYDRQKNLWDQHIGTEVQLLQDKTNVEALQAQLKTLQANMSATQAAYNQTNVYSDVNGTVDEVTAHVGEMFSTVGYIKVVDNGNLKITVTIPENYAGKVEKGSKVDVNIPDLNQSFTGTVSFLSETIGANNRGFVAEIIAPKGLNLKPNQIAKVKILDYAVPSTVVINVNTLQTDLDGKFVLVAAKEDDKLIAKKRTVQIGQSYGDEVEIKSGLQPGDQLITAGYQATFDGQPITTTSTGI